MSSDDHAEIQLLEQNLIKVRNLSGNMGKMLVHLDTRLGRLDNSVTPLQSSTNVLDVVAKSERFIV